MSVGQGVEDGFAFPAAFDQLALLQTPQLVGDGRLAHAQQLRDIAHAHFRLKQDIQDPDAGGVAKDLEQLSQVVQDVLVGHLLVDLFYDILVDAQVLAQFGFVAVRQKCSLLHLNDCSNVIIIALPRMSIPNFAKGGKLYFRPQISCKARLFVRK